MFHRLVRIHTEDGIILDALLYEPESTAGAALVYLHGKGGNFYTGPGRFIPESGAAMSLPWMHLAINMRFHDLGFSLTKRPHPTNVPPDDVSAGGGMWERLSEGIRDVRATVSWLHSLGQDKIFLIGKSSGGYFAAQYAAEGEGIMGVALLSPVHSHRMPFPTWFDNEDQRRQTVEMARTMVARGEGHRLIPLPAWYFAISAHSLVEREDEPEGLWAGWMGRCTLPLLFIVGSAEPEPDIRIWREGFDLAPTAFKRFVHLPGADHSYAGSEALVGEAVVRFVGEVLRDG
jgi:pimeloyl-ACP methyl ester carboxylesterase